MAKKSHKRSVRYEKDQLGCMWGLISIFDFRHGRPTWKLISDKRHGSKHAVGAGFSRNNLEMLSSLDENFQGAVVSDGNVSTTTIESVDACKPSVKKLMEEEMSSEQDITKGASNDNVEAKQCDSSQSRKDHKRTKKTRKKSRDMDTSNLNASENLESGYSCNQDPEHKSRSNFSIDEIMEEVWCQIHQKYINCANYGANGEAPVKSNYKHSAFEEKLCLAIEEFMNQKFSDEKHLTEDQKIHHVRELMDALEVLSSDEELFLKLLQDPNSLLAKYVQNLQDAQIQKEDEESKLSEHKVGDLKQSEELVIRKQRYFFRRKVKPQERHLTTANEQSSEVSKRIVILKPGLPGLRNSETGDTASPESHFIVGNEGPSERVGSHFFLSEIKRKLKNAMGKQQNGASTIGTSNRFPYVHKNLKDSDKGIGKEKVGGSPGKEHFYIERIAKPSTGIKKVDTGKVKESENLGIPDRRVSNIYIEARKHLSEMLSNGNEGADISKRQFPKTLGRMLSLPEFNISPLGSPGRNLEHGFVTAQMRLSPRENFLKANESTWSHKQERNASLPGQVVHDLESLPSVSENSAENKVLPPNSIPSISDDLVHDDDMDEAHPLIIGEMNSDGVVEIEKEKEVVAQEEETILDAPSEPSGSSVGGNKQNGEMSEFGDKRDSECSREDSYEENPVESSPLASPPRSSTTTHVEDLESAIDVPERPSPVSVLEPLFTEEDISASKSSSRTVELPIEPIRILFEDHDPSTTESASTRESANSAKACTEDKDLIFDFVQSVMQASGFNSDEFRMKWLSSDQLIEPSLCDEVEFFPNQLCYNPKLLFDCINEVLVEACGRYYGCFPWVSSVRPSIRPVPDMETAVHEVWVEVYWHLLPLPLPRTLDQIVTKDMSRTGTWMDLRSDSEAIGADMSEAILQELMEDTILSYVDASVVAESDEKEGISNL